MFKKICIFYHQRHLIIPGNRPNAAGGRGRGGGIWGIHLIKNSEIPKAIQEVIIYWC